MKPSVWFWVVGVIALLFEGFGVFQYWISVTNIEAAVASMPPEQAAYYMELPAWRTALFAIGVFSGLAAAILFLMKKKWAVPLFAIGPIVYAIGWLGSFFDGGFAILGTSLIIEGVIFLAILIFFWWFARKQRAKGVLT